MLSKQRETGAFSRNNETNSFHMRSQINPKTQRQNLQAMGLAADQPTCQSSLRISQYKVLQSQKMQAESALLIHTSGFMNSPAAVGKDVKKEKGLKSNGSSPLMDKKSRK